MPQDGLHTLQIRGLDEIVARAGAQRGHRAVHRRVARDDDHFGRFRFLQLAHQLDALAVGQAQIGQQDIRFLPSELDAGLAQAERPRDRETLHPGHFLEPVHDIWIVVDNQSVCHEFLCEKDVVANRHTA